MSTFADLVTEAAAILRGPDISTLLFTYAKQAFRDVQKNPLGPISENAKSANVSVTALALEGSLPTDFGRAISAKFAGEKLPVMERGYRVFFEQGYPDNTDNFSDAPENFAIYGSKILFDGYFTTTKNCVLRYAPKETTPAAETVTFPYSEWVYDIVLSRMVWLGFCDQRDEAAKADWDRLYLQRLADFFGVTQRQGQASSTSKTQDFSRD
jgi:hypothetical protein